MAKDGRGDAHVNRITVTAVHPIDDQSSYVIDQPYGYVWFQFDGEQWRVISESPRLTLVRLGVLRAVNGNVTTDQRIDLSLPNGFSRFRPAAIYAENASASGAAMVGGIYTGVGKTGIQIVASTQTFTPLSGPGTNHSLTVSTPGGQVMTGTTWWLSLSAAQGAPVNFDLHVFGYVF